MHLQKDISTSSNSIPKSKEETEAREKQAKYQMQYVHCYKHYPSSQYM
jgi:hypothetical protein